MCLFIKINKFLKKYSMHQFALPKKKKKNSSALSGPRYILWDRVQHSQRRWPALSCLPVLFPNHPLEQRLRIHLPAYYSSTSPHHPIPACTSLFLLPALPGWNTFFMSLHWFCSFPLLIFSLSKIFFFFQETSECSGIQRCKSSSRSSRSLQTEGTEEQAITNHHGKCWATSRCQPRAQWDNRSGVQNSTWGSGKAFWRRWLLSHVLKVG